MAKATLKYNQSWYTPVQIRSTAKKDAASVRKEYTRLRDIAQKRLKRMEKAGFASYNVYRINIKHYPKLADIGSPEELAQRLSDLSRFIMAKESTVSAIKDVNRKKLRTLHEHGYDFVTVDNLQDFGEFMEEYRAQMLDMEYDSGDAAELYYLTEKHDLFIDDIRDDFEFFLENKKILEDMRRTNASAGDIAKMKSRVARKAKERARSRRA